VSRDLVFVRHILDEIHFLRGCSTGLDLQKLKGDPIMQRAFIRSLEVIGEAVKNLSGDLREEHPEIDWRKAAGLRDKLIHHYFGVDWNVVWDVITNKLPELQVQLEQLVDEMDEEQG
jgi:uncharacterized protein with HEPN domain